MTVTSLLRSWKGNSRTELIPEIQTVTSRIQTLAFHFQRVEESATALQRLNGDLVLISGNMVRIARKLEKKLQETYQGLGAL